MKVLHLLNSNRYSGAENVVCQIFRMMQDEPDMEMLYCSPDGPIREALAERNVPFAAVSSLSVSELKRVIKEFQPDLIHAHDFTAGIISVLAAGRIPIINHLHNNSPWLKSFGVKSIVYGISCLRYKKILTVSESVMDEYVFGKFQKEKTIIVGNPMKLQEIVEKAQAEKRGEQYSVAFLGRFTPQKKPDMFVEIIDELSKRCPDVCAVMIGEGELRPVVEQKIRECVLEDKITLVGFQKNPYSILKCAKVLCMPSGWEGFGLAAVEALALGKPVVAAPVGGLVKIIDDSCGKLCTEKESYVDALYSLLKDEEYYEKQSAGALQRAQKYDNMNEYKNMLCEIYKG